MGTVLINGVITGVLFSLLAIALVILFRTTGVLNFAQGEMGALVAFIAIALDSAGLAPGLAVGLALVSALGVGAFFYFGVIRLRTDDALGLSLRTLAIFLLLRAVVEKIWGKNAPYEFPQVIPEGSIELLGRNVSYVEFGAVAFSLALTIGIVVLLNRTRVGLLLRAVASDRQVARELGVRVTLVDLVSWSLAAVVGAVVAMFFAMTGNLTPGIMDPYLLAGIAAAMLGGLRSLPGAMIGGLILGIAQSASAVYLNQPEWAGLVAFLILLVGVWVTRERMARAVIT